MKRFTTMLLALALAGLFLFMLPYFILTGVVAVLLLRLFFWRPGSLRKGRVRFVRTRTGERRFFRFVRHEPGKEARTRTGERYQQAYSRHWQGMSQAEREAFLNRNAPAE
jgi:hypothetical protein